MISRLGIFLLLFFALFNYSSFAQGADVSGFVNDIHKQPIAYANVLLLKAQDSTIIKGLTTDDKGYFNIKEVAGDNYVLKVSFIGYEDFYKAFDLKKSINLGTLILQESSEELDQVNIMVRRPTLKKYADKLVFNVENTAVIEGNIFDVIKSTPGILVLDNSILVKNATPTVYINDKKVHLSGKDLTQLLEGSAASSIKSIEVITNPSAKYEASSGSVINIVMSKNLITGYRGNVSGNFIQGVFPRYNGGMGHFFKNEKIDLYANYTYSQDKINRGQESVVNYLDATNTVDEIFEDNTIRNTWSKTHNLNFNIDYSLDAKNTLSLSSKILFLPHFKYRINSATNVFDADKNLDYYFDALNLSNDKKHNVGFDLDFVHQFDKEGENLSANLHFTNYDYHRKQTVNSNYYANDGMFINSSDYRTNNQQNTEIFTGNVDYALPIDETSVLRFGAKGSHIKTNSDITQYDILNGIETIDLSNTNAYDYDESIFAGYFNYSKEWTNFNINLGLRAEQTQTKGISIADNVENTQNYLEWFPTSNMDYTFSENFTLYHTYKKSIKRPDYQDLNPFQFYLNDVNIVTGNPELQPVIIQRTELGASLLKGLFTVEVFYQNSENNIFELTLQDNANNIITYKPLNLTSTVEYGLDFITYFNVLENWSIHIQNSLYNATDKGVINDVKLEKSLWSNYSSVNTNLSLLKDRSLSANLSISHLSNSLNGFRKIGDVLFSNLSVSKSLLNNKATLSLMVTDIFNTQDFVFTSKYLNQNNSTTYDQDSRTIRLGFRYKFGNTNLETNQRTSSQQETERLEKE